MNIGSAWKTATNQVIIPTNGGGTYFIRVMAATCFNSQMIINLMVNDESSARLSVYHLFSSGWRASVRERAIILVLAGGDVLSLTMGSGFCLQCTNVKQCGFSGFRLA